MKGHTTDINKCKNENWKGRSRNRADWEQSIRKEKVNIGLYRGADKSLARPRRKQATATEDFEFHISYEGWNFNSGNYLFTTDTK